MRRPALLFSLCLLLLLPPPPICAQDAPTPLQRLQTLVASRPEDGTLRFYLAMRLAAAGEAEAAIRELRRAGELADGLLPLVAEQFPQLQARADFQALVAELEARLPRRLERARRWAVLADRELLPEGIAHDPVSGDSYLTSMKQGSVLRLDGQGRARPFVPAGDAPLIGAVVDPVARRLHVVRSNGFMAAAATRRINRIESYALDDGRQLARIELPEAQGLNDVCLGADGGLFASDSQGGRIWRLDADGRASALAPVVPGVNGLAHDARRGLLFAAHSTGIARIALAGGDDLVARLPLLPREQAAAIDGLYLLPDGDLVGVQNITNPGRVIRLKLDAEGRRALALQTLLSHHHADLLEPTTATLVDGGRRLRLLATTQVSKLQPDGTIAAAEGLRPPVLLDIGLED